MKTSEADVLIEKKHNNVTGLKRLIGPPLDICIPIYENNFSFQNLTTLNVKNAKYKIHLKGRLQSVEQLL
jgi:hypothetical protein